MVCFWRCSKILSEYEKNVWVFFTSIEQEEIWADEILPFNVDSRLIDNKTSLKRYSLNDFHKKTSPNRNPKLTSLLVTSLISCNCVNTKQYLLFRYLWAIISYFYMYFTHAGLARRYGSYGAHVRGPNGMFILHYFELWENLLFKISGAFVFIFQVYM